MKAGWNINGSKRREGMANFLEKGAPALGIKGAQKSSRRDIPD